MAQPRKSAAKTTRGPGHDHARCASDALARAEQVCQERNVRLTPIRRRVLELIWRSHAPVGAYELLEHLRENGRRAAPPTVYRALEFLRDNGLIHRIESRNAFVGCEQPDAPHTAQYLLCDECGDAIELEIAGLARRIETRAAEMGFQVARQTVEANGLCRRCRPDASTHAR